MKRKTFALVAILAILCSLLGTLFTPAAPARAASEGWVNRFVINYKGGFYYDENTYDRTFDYVLWGAKPAEGCSAGQIPHIFFLYGTSVGNYIEDTNVGFFYGRDVPQAIFREYKPLTVAQNIGCEPVDTPITLANPQYRKIVYVSDNNGQRIRHAVEKDVASKTFDTIGGVGQNKDVPAWFRSSDGDASCKDVIVARQARPYIDSSHIDLQSGFDLTGSFTLYAVRQGQGPKDSASYSTDIIDSPGIKCQTGFNDGGEVFSDITEHGYGLTAAEDPGGFDEPAPGWGSGGLLANGLCLMSGCGTGYHPGGGNADDAFIIYIGTVAANTMEKPTGTPDLTQVGDSDPGEPDPCVQDSGSFGWIICPMQDQFGTMLQWIDEKIIGLLQVNTKNIFGPDLGRYPLTGGDSATQQTGSTAFRIAWTAFRTIAYALLVIVGLIMVISQIFGLDIFDAYTIRKMLPKLVIAAVSIPLLWPFLAFLFNMGNAASDAVWGLIVSPFNNIPSQIEVVNGPGGAKETLIPSDLGLGGFGWPALTAVIVGSLIYIGIGGVGVALALLASAAITILSALFVIIGRDIVIYMLVIFSPIAVVCATFAPLAKAFALWRRLLVTTFLSISAVAGVLATSKVAAIIALLSSDGVMGPVLALIMIGAGYALFWQVFKSMDKISGQIANAAGKVTAGAQKALSGFRSNRVKQNWGLFKQGALNTRFGRAFGGIGERIGASQAARQATGRGLGKGEVRKQNLANFRAAMAAERLKNPMAAGSTRAQDDTINALIVEGLSGDALVRRHIELHGIKEGRSREEEERDVRRRLSLAETNLGGSAGMVQTRLAAWKSLQASGSAFRASDYKGLPEEQRWHAASEGLYRAGASLVHDGILSNSMDMAADIKGFKRHDHRGASFGDTATQADASVKAYDTALDEAGGDRAALAATGGVMTSDQYDKITDSAIKNVSGPMMAQERDETADRYALRLQAVLPLLPQKIQDAQQAIAAAQQALAANPPGSQAHQEALGDLQKAEAAAREPYQILAQIAGFRDYQAGASRGVAAELASLMETPLPPQLGQILGVALPPGTTVEQYLREHLQNIYAAAPMPDEYAAMRRESAPYPGQGGGQVGGNQGQQGQGGPGQNPPPPQAPHIPPPPEPPK